MQNDLKERTKKFSKDIIHYLLKIKMNEINRNIVSQLCRSATSDGASPKKDFRNKIFICRKEIQETKYWIELLAEASPSSTDSLKNLWKESQELTPIFNKISSSLKETLKN